MGGAVVDFEGLRSPANINSQSFPGEGLLEDALAGIAREEQAVRLLRADSGKKLEFGDAHVLGFIDDGEGVGIVAGAGQVVGDLTEHGGPGQLLALIEPVMEVLEDLPQQFSLFAAQASAATDAGDIAVGFPGGELPYVYHVSPFAPEKGVGEFAIGKVGGAGEQTRSHLIQIDQCRGSAKNACVEFSRHFANGFDLDAAYHGWLVAD